MGDVWLGEKFTPEHSSGTCMVTTMKAAGEGVIYTPELSDSNCMAVAMIAQVEVQYPSGFGVLAKQVVLKERHSGHLNN